tara:strand:- start:1328 stop:1945 length:618 start_codon:yes stop_codon:yes gene_type:complete
MKINQIYLEASFISFVIHASIILYLFGFFYYESQQTSILSKPIEVNLLFEDRVEVKKQFNEIPEPKEIKIDNTLNEIISDKTISFDYLIPSVSLNDLIAEDKLISKESEQNQVELYGSIIIESIQSAWRKPINIQDGLVCDLRLSINKNGRITNVNLIRSSGNLRFDNSALKAVQRVETFSFFKDIPYSLYNSNFKSLVITFNPK